MSNLSPTPTSTESIADTAGALRVLSLSTTAFTLLFAVWLFACYVLAKWMDYLDR